MSETNQEMSEEELRARSEAALLGQLQILRAAVEALIATASKPDYIQLRIAQELAAIGDRKPPHPLLSWMPQAVTAGAEPVARQFLDACQSNRKITKD